MPVIYKSTFPDVEIPRRSIFTHLLPTNSPYADSLPAFIDAPTGKSVTRGELRDHALRFAYGLTGDKQVLASRGGPQLARGDVVAIFSPNTLSFTLALYGCFAAGVLVSPLNSSYTPHEVSHQIMNSRAKVIVVHPQLLPTLLKGLAAAGFPAEDAQRRIIVANWRENFDSIPTGYTLLDELVNVGKLEREVSFDGRYADETTLLCYSSGTTGLAKGVETTHRNLVSIMCMFPSVFIDVKPEEDKMLGFLPGYHIYGLVKALLYPISRGVATVIIRGFDIEMFSVAIHKYKVSVCAMVPPVILLLAKHPVFEKFDFSHVKLVTSGGAPLGADLTREATARLKKLGSKAVVVQGYGLTETSPTSHYNPMEYWDTKAGTIGPLLPNLEARLVQDDGTDAREGERGELWIRGPSIMKGYLHNATATFNSITPDGWFQTGDIAVRSSDGWYSIVDRKKELIKYKGFQVPPADLEAVLLTHDDIVDSGVIGVYSEKEATELPRAYIVPRAGASVLQSRVEREKFQQDVERWIRGKVARHKYLRGGVVCVEAIPKSAAGKILRKELRARAKKELSGSETERTRL
ncbi:hypothetical protein M408DRAFT_329499 [Serendipita vermifera MAFF 305830]|uniref:AMP-dependent synthetase/ligase domain-containing protein n=1 Tax=Serendipita vermifera MAFF 305830 TaxID=933852 RepID=A0A0C3BAF8_SERVB|nr:hypothetical protein M408DRAFT_329499 [Serendipita vermifera MAFF 305830]